MMVIYSVWALVDHTNSPDSFREEDFDWEKNIYDADGIEDIGGINDIDGLQRIDDTDNGDDDDVPTSQLPRRRNASPEVVCPAKPPQA